MSLVNDMLADLEKNRAKPQAEVDLGWMQSAEKINKKPPVAMMQALVVLLTAIICGLIVWLFSSGDFAPALTDGQITNATVGDVAETAVEKNSEIQTKAVAIPTVTTGEPESSTKSDVSMTNNIVPENIEPIEATASASPTLDAGQSKAGQLKVEKIQTQPADRQQSVTERQSTRQNNTARPAVVVKKALLTTPELRDKKAAKNAFRLLQSGQPGRAENVLLTLLEELPYAAESTELLLSMRIDQRRFDEAKTLANQALKVYPDRIVLHQLQARAFLLEGDAASAVDILEVRRPSLEKNVSYYELLALAAQQAKRYPLSEQVYQALLTFDSTRGDWFVGLAISAELQGNIEGARKAYTKALRLTNTNDQLRQYARQRLAAVAGL